MLDQLVKVGMRNKVKPDYKELNKKKKLFQTHVKAQIARKIWGNEGFYPVFNETNEVFQHSLKVFDRIPELDRSKM
jgi:carboxyl-terminal processing protease